MSANPDPPWLMVRAAVGSRAGRNMWLKSVLSSSFPPQITTQIRLHLERPQSDENALWTYSCTIVEHILLNNKHRTICEIVKFGRSCGIWMLLNLRHLLWTGQDIGIEQTTHFVFVFWFVFVFVPWVQIEWVAFPPSVDRRTHWVVKTPRLLIAPLSHTRPGRRQIKRIPGGGGERGVFMPKL